MDIVERRKMEQMSAIIELIKVLRKRLLYFGVQDLALKLSLIESFGKEQSYFKSLHTCS